MNNETSTTNNMGTPAWKHLLIAGLFIVAFFAIMLIVQTAGAAIYAYGTGSGFQQVMVDMATGNNGKLLAVTTVFYSLITIILFGRLKWAPMSNNYLKTHPWGVVFWAVLLAMGTILPTEWIYEKLQIAMSNSEEQLFESIMKEPWGYLAIGILAPVAEEVVFRGGVLRRFLAITGEKKHWIAIVASALVFGLIHGNMAQGVHAFVIGLILGWMFYRTGSIIPGIILHWVNNSVAYFMYALMPQMNDGKLIDLFHGDTHMMYGGLFFSLCILVPAILQLNIRMKKE